MNARTVAVDSPGNQFQVFKGIKHAKSDKHANPNGKRTGHVHFEQAYASMFSAAQTPPKAAPGALGVPNMLCGAG